MQNMLNQVIDYCQTTTIAQTNTLSGYANKLYKSGCFGFELIIPDTDAIVLCVGEQNHFIAVASDQYLMRYSSYPLLLTEAAKKMFKQDSSSKTIVTLSSSNQRVTWYDSVNRFPWWNRQLYRFLLNNQTLTIAAQTWALNNWYQPGIANPLQTTGDEVFTPPVPTQMTVYGQSFQLVLGQISSIPKYKNTDEFIVNDVEQLFKIDDSNKNVKLLDLPSISGRDSK